MVTIRGVELAWDLSGDGSDLVWGHGLTSSRSSEDDLEIIDWAQIRAGHRVLRYDARGHGQSGSTPDPDGYSWRSLALDQLELATHVGIDRYVAGGASMGCATALHAAVLAPQRVRGLLLVIPPTAWATRAAQTGAYAVMGDLVETGDHEPLLAGAASSPSPDPFIDDPRWKARFPRLLADSDPVRLARIFRGAATADLPAADDIAAIGVPTLILAWSGDPGHPVSTAARLQELIATSELAVAATPDDLKSWTPRAIDFLAQL